MKPGINLVLSVFLLGAWLAGSAFGETARFSPAQREHMLVIIESSLEARLDEPLMEECWRAATDAKDEIALSALFVMARAWPLFQQVDALTRKILSESENPAVINERLRELYRLPSLTKHESLIRAYAPAMRYCEGRLQAARPGAYADIEAALEERAGPDARAYLDMMGEGR